MISIVPQDSFLFNDSIKNNIAFGKLGASLDEIKMAAKKANANEFINDLPQLYDTLIGERGVRLSGGQRQRISIARAILKNSPILILDEATASLDSDSEKKVHAAIDNLIIDRTVIIIAHRLSTIINADNIVVMDKNRIVETGTHKELLDKLGIYKSLYDLQFKDDT
jgi:subfamily B ATP-binding cassette protein MsbA